MVISSLKLLSQLALRNVIRNKRRSLITAAAVSVGIWSSVSLAAFARGVSNEMALNAIFDLTGHMQINSAEYRQDPVIEHSIDDPVPSVQQSLKRFGVTHVARRTRVPAVIMSEHQSTGLNLVGIDPGEERGLSFIGKGVFQGEMLASANSPGILLGKKMLEILNTQVGKRVVLMSQGMDGSNAERGFRIIGAFDAELESTEKAFAFIGRNVAQEMLGAGSKISEVSLLMSDRNNVEALRAELVRELPGLKITPWLEISPMVKAIVDLQGAFLRFWFLIVVVAISFGLINTLFMSIFERIREIGLMQALGMPPVYVLTQIVFESALIILAGSFLGNIFGVATVYFMSGGVDISAFAKSAEIIGISRIVYPVILRLDFLTLNIMVWTLCILGSVYPAWRASRYTPVEALNTSH